MGFALGTKPDNLSLMPRIHVVKESTDSYKLSFDLNMNTMVHTYRNAHTHTLSQIH